MTEKANKPAAALTRLLARHSKYRIEHVKSRSNNTPSGVRHGVCKHGLKPTDSASPREGLGWHTKSTSTSTKGGGQLNCYRLGAGSEPRMGGEPTRLQCHGRESYTPAAELSAFVIIRTGPMDSLPSHFGKPSKHQPRLLPSLG